jgi:hypothetical protein
MNKTILIFVWVLTAASAYWWGFATRPEALGDNPGIAQNDGGPVSGKVPPLPPKSSTVASSGVEVLSVGPDGELPIVEVRPREIISNEEDVLTRIRSSNPVVRMQAFAELLQNGDAESIQKALEAFKKLPGGPSRFSELRMLAFSWAQVDPEGAMKWTQEQDRMERYIGSGAVMDSWSRSDPTAAIAWAKENFDGEDNPYFIGIISGMSETDMSGATELMTSMPYGRSRGRAASVLLERSWTQGEEVAMNWADNLPEGSLKNFAYGQIGEKIAREDLGRAVEWVDGMEESEIKTAVSEDVAERWARKSPEEAAQWVGKMPEGEARSESMEEVVSQWARKDPTATAEWLNEFPAGELMDEPIQRFVREVVRKDPETAMTWAEAIVNEERKERTVSEVKRVAEHVAKQAEAAESGEPQQETESRGPGGGGRRGPSFLQPR